MTRKTYPNLEEGVGIAKLLGVSAEYFITGTEPEGLDTLERKLINAFRKLSSTDKENALLAVNAWAEKTNKSEF
jgi:hypothetical protein